MIKNIGFIGAGNMAYALVQAIIEQETAVQVNVFDVRPERMDLFAGDFTRIKLKKGNRDLASACGVMGRTYNQPVLVERYLSGREFTVGIIGTGADAEVLGTVEVILLAGAEAGVYSYVNKARCEELVQYRSVRSSEEPLIQKTEDIALNAWQVLGCRDAGRVDIRCDEAGQPCFLEINPLAGLHPDHSDLPIICKGIPLSYEVLIERILASALKRINRHKPPKRKEI